MLFTLLAATAVAISFGPTNASIGDTLERSYGVYAQLPTTTTEAKAKGWVPMSSKCTPGLGVAWAEQKVVSGAALNTPLLAKHGYINESRVAPQVSTLLWAIAAIRYSASGVGVTIFGEPKTSLIKAGYFVPVAGIASQYFLSVSFRQEPNRHPPPPSRACGEKAPHWSSAFWRVETRHDCTTVYVHADLIVNAGPGGIKQSLPLTAKDALSEGWVKGSCFAGMGTHWFRDLSAAGKLSWEASNLLPVVTMYDEESESARGYINAFFFASSVVQQSFLPPNSNEWEPVPLPNILMCKNFCSSDCTFHDTSFFSTMHIYLSSNRPKVTCTGGCSIGCCASTQHMLG